MLERFLWRPLRRALGKPYVVYVLGLVTAVVLYIFARLLVGK